MLKERLLRLLIEHIEAGAKTYTGIGSRETPSATQGTIYRIAEFLARNGLTLRSGGADGADQAFERGAVLGPSEIYLPWKGFNGNRSLLFDIPAEAFTIAGKFHPGWNHLTEPVRRLMARNAQQVLGMDLNSPSAFVLCWTPDGADGLLKKTTSKTGGTGQAIRIAAHYGVPVINLR